MARLDVEALYRNYGHSVLRRARQIMANEDDAVEIYQICVFWRKCTEVVEHVGDPSDIRLIPV